MKSNGQFDGRLLTFEVEAEDAVDNAKLKRIDSNIDDFMEKFRQLINDF